MCIFVEPRSVNIDANTPAAKVSADMPGTPWGLRAAYDTLFRWDTKFDSDSMGDNSFDSKHIIR